jgi:hypothetical protein
MKKLERTKSEPVIRLLRAAPRLKKKDVLNQDIADFFDFRSNDRKERRAFQKATKAALARD